MKRITLSSISVFISILFTGLALAQDSIIFPAKGQSQEQVEKDKFSCYQRAKNETGFNPLRKPTASAPLPQKQAGAGPSTEAQSAEAKGTVSAQPSGEAELAQELSNPLADLMTIPIQMNYDRGIGPSEDGWKLQTNIQPVIPFSLNKEWNLISRTIIPVIDQEDIFPGAGSQFGLGDINLSLFFSPSKPTSDGLIWGIGPVLLLPTATDSLLGAKKWGAGPAAVALTVRGPWTVGMLANHIWSYAGDSDRQDISSTFLQPFAAYTWPSAWTASVQSESTYNWKTDNWSVPINVAFSKLIKLSKLPVSLQAGVGYWVESPESGPEGFRFRLQATFVLPKLF